MKRSLQTCPNTAGSHLTSCSGVSAKQATRRSGSRQTGAQGGSPSTKNIHSLLMKEDTSLVLTACHALSQWIPRALSCSLGVAWLALGFVTEPRALRSQVQCWKESKLKIDYICKLLPKTSILRECKNLSFFIIISSCSACCFN